MVPQAVALIRTFTGSLPNDPDEFWTRYTEIKATIKIVAQEIAVQLAPFFGIKNGGTL